MTTTDTYGLGKGGTEPSLNELLSDSVAADVMRADGVTIEAVRAALSNARKQFKAETGRAPVSGHDWPEGMGRAWLDSLRPMDDDGLVKLGLRRDQIARLRNTPAAEAGELSSMMARIGVDAQEASLPVRIDLHLNCTECTGRRLCTRWLASGHDGAGYRVFCPNNRLLDRLIQIRRWRGAAGKGEQSETARANFKHGTLTPAALKRARKLARSGACKNLAEISDRLKLEGTPL